MIFLILPPLFALTIKRFPPPPPHPGTAFRTQISSCNKAATTAPPFLFLPSPFDFEYEYEPLDELIATPPFTRCACYYRYTYGRLAGWHCYGILHVSPSQIRLSVVPLKSTFRAFGLHVYFVRLYSAEIDFTFILRRVLPPLMGPLRPTRGPKAPRNGGRGVRVRYGASGR